MATNYFQPAPIPSNPGMGTSLTAAQVAASKVQTPAQRKKAKAKADADKRVADQQAAARAREAEFAPPAQNSKGDTWTGTPGGPTQGKTNVGLSGDQPVTPVAGKPPPAAYDAALGDQSGILVTIGGLGLGAAEGIPGQAAVSSRQITLQELEAEFWALPAYQQAVIEKQLYAGGFFQPSFKASDLDKLGTPQSFADVALALKNAGMAASISGTEFTSMVAKSAVTGAPPAPPVRKGIVGHGANDFTQLTNPDDVRAMAQSISNDLLGRGPTEDELASITKTINDQERAAGLTKFTADEAAAKQDFAARQADADANFALANQQNAPGNVGATPVMGPQDAGLVGLGTGAGTATTPTTTASASTPSTIGPITLATTPKGAPGVAAFLAATIAHESVGSGQYTALNKGSGAGGAYQFLPSTWRGKTGSDGVAARAGYGQYANTPPQQVPPAVQDAVAAWYATYLYSKTGGDWAKVAKAWYGGEGMINAPDNNQPNKGLSLGAYASFVTNYMAAHGTPGDPSSAGLAGVGTGAGTVAGSQYAGAGYVNPLSQGSWGLARTDMGVDYIPKTPSPILAIGDGVVIKSIPQGSHSGWPGAGPAGSNNQVGAWLAYRLTSGPAAGQVVYVAENLSGVVPVGTQVHAGQQIAVGMPGYPYIETGWANSTGNSPITTYGKNADGTPMEGGKDFARLMIRLGAGAMQDPGDGPIYPGGPNAGTIQGGSASTNTAGGATAGPAGTPNDQYTAGTNTTLLSPASAQNEIAVKQSTGPNLIPYGAHTMLDAVGTINNMIRTSRGVPQVAQ